MTRTAVKIGPGDQGKRMSLKDFDHAEAQDGYNYELSRGVILVSDVPDDRHLAQVDDIRQQLAEYRAAHRGIIQRVAGSGECKILLPQLETERHPDVAVYKTRSPEGETRWERWVPEVA